jgi:hypothetical protein
MSLLQMVQELQIGGSSSGRNGETRIGSTMSTSLAQEPFTRLEIAAGSIAVAAVVLITMLGPRFSPPFSRPLSQPLSQPQELATPAPSNSSVSASGARQWRRGSSGAAREPSNPSPDGSGTTRALPPPNAVSGPVSPTAPNPIAPTAPGPVAADPAIDVGAGRVAAAQPAETQRAATPNAPLDAFPFEQAPSARQWTQTREAALAPPPGTERDSVSRFDARLVQARLHELGYYSGNGGGVWGAASRNALRDFKSMNGLQDDDKWDKETEQRLLSRQSIHAASTFVGGWAPDAGTCPGRADTGARNMTRVSQEFWSTFSFPGIDTRSRPPQPIRDGGAPLVRISSRGAETAGAKCDFRSVRRATPSKWQIQAVCSADGQSWNAHVSLTLNGTNLTWSSERGSIKYVRCS